jgi:glycosyltransferase involved in cell wall biosynthesis
MDSDFCSVIITTYRHGEREEISKKSIISLLQNTTYPYEFILIDNTQNNRGLGLARNAGYDFGTGNYICFTDDDIDFEPGWLEECIKMVNLGDHYMATPVHQPRIGKWELPPVEGYRQNFRAGSNCMVMKTEAFLDIGRFITNLENPVRNTWRSGQLFTDALVRKGYSVLITKEPMAKDMAFRKHSYL